MNEIVKEWLEKAEEDFLVMTREMRARKFPAFNAVCFHAQQCIEKLFKALLIKKNKVPPKTHDLIELNRLLENTGIIIGVEREELRILSVGAVLFRYPGESADKEMAKDSVKICRKIRNILVTEIHNND